MNIVILLVSIDICLFLCPFHLLCRSQVKTAVEKSGPLHRLGAKISEIKAGLGSVQSWLEQKNLNFNEAESTQKVRHEFSLLSLKPVSHILCCKHIFKLVPM